jgi:hypothetical protein
MRDPASHFDPQSDIEDTCQFLEKHMQSESWKADPDGFACGNRAAVDAVEASNLDDWAKPFAILALLEQTRKRRGKPTRHGRDHAIQLAAARLVGRGYRPTRNDVTADKESASSIIHRALQRLGEKLSEKSINGIVAKVGADYFIKRKAPPAFVEWLREHASDFVDLFESDPDAPDIVDLSGRPVVLKKSAN